MQPAPQGAVLVIDDEEGIRAVLTALLESIGIETIEASDARSALQQLAENKERISACMLDMNLEDAYGEDLYDQLREIVPNLTVFAMSGIYGDEIQTRLGNREVAGLISKPFSAGQLIETVTKGLNLPR